MELIRALAPHGSREEWFLGGVALLAAIALMLATRVIAPRAHRVPFGAAIAFIILATLGFFARQIAMPWVEVRSLFAGMAILFYALAIARLLFLFAFDGVIMRNRTEATPKILRDIGQGTIIFFSIIVALRAAGVEAGQLLTTSALITVVAGMALQETLGNLVAGLAMQGERPFEVGDWIEVHGNPGHIGKVREINWRATRLHTLDNVDVVVPNGLLAKAVFTNYDRPHEAARRSVYFHTPYGVPPRRVHEVVLDAIREAPGVLATPPPSMVTFGFDDAGVQFWLRYFIDEMGRRDAIDGGVRDRIWYGLDRAGIGLSVSSRTVSLHEVSEASEHAKLERRIQDRAGAIRTIDLFATLEDEDVRRLAEDARSQLFAPGEKVIEKGERGDTMFVVRTGELSVRIGENGAEAARLGPGSFFGEMSLLTGDPRQATVVATASCELLVVDHAAFQRLLDRHPDVARQVSDKVIERRKKNLASAESAAKPEAEAERESDDLVDRIKSFFGLRRV
jgi:small-conductance mechanosensitive channel